MQKQHIIYGYKPTQSRKWSSLYKLIYIHLHGQIIWIFFKYINQEPLSTLLNISLIWIAVFPTLDIMNKYLMEGHLVHHNLTKRILRSAWAQKPSVQFTLNTLNTLKYICGIFVININNVHSLFFPFFRFVGLAAAYLFIN